jgi:NADPH-dependent 2,4-dienoyl-CoA reductase/sulfur reductase-like enzyme
MRDMAHGGRAAAATEGTPRDVREPAAMRGMAHDARELAADVVVVGAGPAGLAAALAAARDGVRVTMIDAAPVAGGQIWRARRGVAVEVVARALAQHEHAGVRALQGTRVVMPLPGQALLIDGPHGAQRLRWRRLILATGARERLLPFPGWTLPGVFGAGGLQALVKGAWPIAGQRVVVAGTGPLLLAAAATLRGEGARIVALAEETPMSTLAGLVGALLRHPRKALDALRLARALAGVTWMSGTRIVAVEGEGRVERVRLASLGGDRLERVIDCDAVAAGWGLVPQTELAEALGCAIEPRFGAQAVVVDARQRTDVDGVFAIGECTGVAGAAAAAIQGQVAGDAAALDLTGQPRGASSNAGVAREDLRRGASLEREFRFAAAVAKTFPVPTDWAARLRDDTIVCRCEDVRWSALRDAPDLRAAKLATRCGMGHCQGRLCHDALGAMLHVPRLPARPPLTPVALDTFLSAESAPRGALDPDDDSLPTEERPT